MNLVRDMSAKEPEDKSFSVKTAEGAFVSVRCPICDGKQFGSASPPQDKRKLGFRHVIVGREVESGIAGKLSTLTVRFKYCLSCGYVLKFMLLESEKDWGEEP